MSRSEGSTGGDYRDVRSATSGHMEQLRETEEVSDIDQVIESLEKAIPEMRESSKQLAKLNVKLGDTLIQRFRLLGDPVDLETAATYLMKGVELRPGRYTDPVKRVIKLGSSAYSRYERLSEIADLNKAIACESLTVSLTPEGHPNRSERLDDLAISLHTRFKRLGDIKDLDKDIEYSVQALSLTPEGYSSRPERLASLAISLHDRFKWLGNIADLDKAIEYIHHALTLTPDGHPHRPRRLAELGVYLRTRFKRLGDIKDLDKVIEYSVQALSLTPEGHYSRPEKLADLAISLHDRFEWLGDIADLDKAIEYSHQALSLAPEGHLDRPRRLADLGVYLHTQFKRLGDVADLDKAIEYIHQALTLTPDGHPHRPRRLAELSVYLQSRFERLGDIADLDKAIEYSHQAISLTPEDHFYRPRRLADLAISLHARFEWLGDIADLDKVIEYSIQALSLAPEGHLDRPRLLADLGAFLHARFERLGDIADLDRTIEHKHQALSLTPDGHPDRPGRLANLSASLHARFKRLGDIADLDKELEYSIQALSLTTEGHIDRPRLLADLGVYLHARFQRLGDVADLDNAIDYPTQALSLTPEGHLDRPRRLADLCVYLHTRFEWLGNVADLDKAIEYSHQALTLTPESHLGRPRRLAGLGIYLDARFEWLDDVADLDRAIEHKRQAASLTPEGHPDRPRWFDTLVRDLRECIQCFRSAAESSTGTPQHRFTAALHWARLPPHNGNPTILCAYTQALRLLPQLVWLGTSVASRYDRILDVAGSMSTEAAAIAISKQEYALALEWLEEGRSIVWKQMLQLRTPMDELSAVNSALATELKQVARDLENASSPKTLDHVESSDNDSLEQAARRHRQLANRWQDLVDRARQLPGLEAFLRPQKASDLIRSAKSGPVVVINIHKSRCDALVIQPGVTEISHIPLRFSVEQAQISHSHMLQFVSTRGLDVRGFQVRRHHPKGEFKRTLGVLWKDVVKPVLGFLGYLLPSTGELPHITWCTTGPLSFLPLHAAGDYASQDLTCNYVISSYTPTLSALLSPAPNQSLFAGVLAVGQESTPNMNPLPGTVAELTRIQQQAQGHVITRLDEDLATPAAVMDGMESHSWVHLACHASQNLTNPLHSAFYLHGGKLDLATITQKHLKNADLAFLSTCQTATGDESLSEEAVHLAAGMMMAGYRSVIATMWSIGDEDAPLVAEKVYGELFRGGVPDARRAAVAVHKATACLREKVGAEAFEKWVPYIHIGQ